MQSGQTRSFAPGVFCEKLEIKDGATVTLEPGIHVIRDTEFIINSGGRVIAQNVMIYLQDNRSRINFNGGSSIDLRAPATGGYAGIAVFQDRSAATDYHILNSNSSSRIEGVVYLPNNDLHLNSGSSFGKFLPVGSHCPQVPHQFKFHNSHQCRIRRFHRSDTRRQSPDMECG